MRTAISLICGSVVLIGTVARADQRTVTPQTYLVGAAVRDITPDYPIRLSGFGSRRTESEGVTVPIHARALAIGSDADGPAVLIAVDTTGVSDALVSEIARRLLPLGIRRERLAVTGTHTHTAPMISGVLPTLFGQPVPPEHQAHIHRYTAELTDDLEAVAREALSKRQPARLSWSIGKVGFAKNRRTAGGPTDHALPVLAARAPDGTLRAVVTTYANHAVTLSHNFIGGDWPGFAAAAIEEKHPGAVALVSIGCGADQNPTSNVTGDKVDVARSQGAELAAEVERVLGGPLKPVTGPLTARLERIDLPLAPLPPREHWESLATKPSAVGYHAQVQLAALDRGDRLPVKVDYPIETWTFGDSLAMVFLAGEVVVDYSLRLKSELDASRLWVTAYANDTPCYIPSERVLKEGGYEGGGAMTYYNKPAPFAEGVEQRIVDAVLRLLPASYKPKPEDALARSLLDAAKPNAEREKLLADSSSVDAGALIAAMVNDLEPGTPEEVRAHPVDLAGGGGGRPAQPDDGDEIASGRVAAESGRAAARLAGGRHRRRRGPRHQPVGRLARRSVEGDSPRRDRPERAMEAGAGSGRRDGRRRAREDGHALRRVADPGRRELEETRRHPHEIPGSGHSRRGAERGHWRPQRHQGQGSRPGSDLFPEESPGAQSQRRAERAAPG